MMISPKIPTAFTDEKVRMPGPAVYLRKNVIPGSSVLFFFLPAVLLSFSYFLKKLCIVNFQPSCLGQVSGHDRATLFSRVTDKPDRTSHQPYYDHGNCNESISCRAAPGADAEPDHRTQHDKVGKESQKRHYPVFQETGVRAMEEGPERNKVRQAVEKERTGI
jgi:hypothetical protein